MERLLIIVGPTRRKAVDHPDRVTPADVAEPAALAVKRQALAGCARPALAFYTGNQMPPLRAGLALLAETLGAGQVDLRFLSPAFGLVPAAEPLVPYDVDLTPMGPRGARAWMAGLNIDDQIARAVEGAPLSLLALGEKYLRTLSVPVLPPPGARLIALAKPDWAERLAGPGVTVVPLGAVEAKRLGASPRAARGVAVLTLARSLAAAAAPAALLAALRTDDTPATARRLLGL